MESQAPTLDELIPHRPPMSLLDEIVAIDGDSITCRTTIRQDSIFLRPSGIHPIVTLELMAQACAAFSGVVLRERGEREQLGFLVSVPYLDLEIDRIAVGDVIDVVCAPVFRGKQAGAFDCSSHRGGELVAKARLVAVGKGTNE